MFGVKLSEQPVKGCAVIIGLGHVAQTIYILFEKTIPNPKKATLAPTYFVDFGILTEVFPSVEKQKACAV